MEKQQRLEKEKEFKRGIILDAAKSLFEEKGFENTTIDKIAAKCGFAKGSIYNYFVSKDEIIESLLLECVKDTKNKIKAIVSEKIPCSQKIKKMSDLHYKISLQSPQKDYEKYFNEHKNLIAYVKDVFTKVNKYENEILEDIVAIIEEGKELGEFDSSINAKKIAPLFMYYSKGVLLYIWLHEDIDKRTYFSDNKEIIDAHIEFMLKGLRN